MGIGLYTGPADSVWDFKQAPRCQIKATKGSEGAWGNDWEVKRGKTSCKVNHLWKASGIAFFFYHVVAWRWRAACVKCTFQEEIKRGFIGETQPRWIRNKSHSVHDRSCPSLYPNLFNSQYWVELWRDDGKRLKTCTFWMTERNKSLYHHWCCFVYKMLFLLGDNCNLTAVAMSVQQMNGVRLCDHVI